MLFQNYAKDNSIWSVTFQQIIDFIPEQIIILKIDVEGSECRVSFKMCLFIIVFTILAKTYLSKTLKVSSVDIVLISFSYAWKLIKY